MGFLRDLKKKINKAVVNKVNNAFRKASPSIKERIRKETPDIWKNTNTYRSLIERGARSLNHEFGFPEGTAQTMVDGFIEDAANSLEVRHNPFMDSGGKEYSGSFDVFVLRQDLSETLSSSFASFITEKGFTINWAEWLLVRGNEIIVSTHTFKAGSKEYSRSGDGIMVKSKKNVWRVPLQHSGTINDNWLTRSLVDASFKVRERYQVIIEQELGRTLR